MENIDYKGFKNEVIPRKMQESSVEAQRLNILPLKKLDIGRRNHEPSSQFHLLTWY